MSGYCANCQQRLHGVYCSHCGQHVHESARKVGTLLHDGWHSITHVDHRIWRTLRVLLTKPGALTAEYFANRRAQYVPPFRLYLIVSLLYFALVSIFVSGNSVTGDLVKIDAADDFNAQSCRTLGDLSGMEALDQRIRRACIRIAESGGGAVGEAFMAYIPRALFFFLPLMAAVLLLLYWRPRRLYVEHLVLLLHNHAVAFLVLLFMLCMQGVARLWAGFQVVADVLEVAAFLVMAVYFYLAMRRYYGQKTWATLAKYCLTGMVYVVAFVAMLILTVALSALSLA